MQLNEIIEENTLPTISRKTRISVENLEALLAGDWERLKKVQALGFISILEREYHIDLGEMRAECRAYFEAHPPVEEEGVALAAAAPADSIRHKPSKTLLVIVVLLAALGGYVLFFSPVENGGEPNATDTEHKSGFFTSVLNTAQGWFGTTDGKSEMGEEPAAEEVPPAVEGAWAENNGSGEEKSSAEKGEKSVAGETATAAEGTNETPRTEKESAAPDSPESEEARIIQQVKKEQAKAEEIRQQTAMEKNMSAEGSGTEPLSDISRMILAATAGAATETEGESMEPEVPSLKQEKGEKRAPEAGAEENTAAAAEETPVAAEEEPAPETQGVTASLVIMHPRSKIWVGYTNLRDMKRIAKVTADDITFDTAAGDYILAVGHGLIDFKTAEGEKKLNDGKRHFFVIAKGGVREISHEEFQRLNKSKVW